MLVGTQAAKARENTDKPLKLQNLDLYYSHLHIKCYYFCQQCKDQFEMPDHLVINAYRLLQDFWKTVSLINTSNTKLTCNETNFLS